jgi:diketogulonate reductase-like aldo/keto reductase
VQVALAWVRARPRHTLIPILGARNAAQLREQLGCLDLHLSPEQRARLDAATAIDLGFPSTFIESSQVRTLMFGNTFDKLQRRDT